MNSGFPSPVPRPASFRRVGVYRFLAILTLPVLLLLGATCILIMYHLADIEKLAADTNEKRLPGILAAQRTLINIENMRRNVAMIYNAQDPRLRRNALIDALALASESVFEPDSGFIDYARTAERRGRRQPAQRRAALFQRQRPPAVAGRIARRPAHGP